MKLLQSCKIDELFLIDMQNVEKLIMENNDTKRSWFEERGYCFSWLMNALFLLYVYSAQVVL